MPHHLRMQFIYVLVSVIPLAATLGGKRMRDRARYPAVRRLAWTGVILTTFLAAIELVPYLARRVRVASILLDVEKPRHQRCVAVAGRLGTAGSILPPPINHPLKNSV